MNTLLVRWFSIVLVYSFLFPAVSLAQTPQEGLVQSHNIFLPLVKYDPLLMEYVPEGEFMMGCYPAPGVCEYDDEYLHAVWLDSFWIEKFEVTNAQFAKCVEADCTPPSNFSSNTHPSYYDNPAFADYPLLSASWEDAQNFCLWNGKRLPTEAEWEKAVRGNNDTRFYPWGDQAPDCTMANFYNTWDGQACINDTTQVGSYPVGVSQYGLMDMAGNVAEWVSDWFDADYYRNSPYMNPTGPSSGTEKILRGGSWYSNGFTLQVTDRWPQNPDVEYNWLGFRCAFSPER